MCHRFAGASLSLTKSKTLTVGILNTETDPMGISYVKSENVLYDSPSDDRRDEPLLMVFLCYTYTTFTVLSIPTRPEPFEVRPFFNIFQFSQLWYQTQILRIVNEELRHINSATAWFIWSGSVFRMPLSIVYLEPQEEGLGLIDVKAKFITFFLNQCI